jgi:hypothetical protein
MTPDRVDQARAGRNGRTAARRDRDTLRRRWFVTNVGILYGITFAAALIGLRLPLRRWPRRLTAWLLTPLLTWAVLWTWPADGEGSWWVFGLGLVCVGAAASLVRI